jgi:hypothetical protein
MATGLIIDSAILIYCTSCDATVPAVRRPIQWVIPESPMTIDVFACPHCNATIGYPFNASADDTWLRL